MCLLSTHISSLITRTGDNTYLMGLSWEVTELKYAKHFESYWHIHIQWLCPIIIFSLLYYSLSDHVGWPKSVIHKYKKKFFLISSTLQTLNGQDQCLPKALTGHWLLHQLPTSVPITVHDDQWLFFLYFCLQPSLFNYWFAQLYLSDTYYMLGTVWHQKYKDM